MPILADGDVIGSVCSVVHGDDGEKKLSDEIEVKLIQTAAGFLGKQMEG